MATTSSALPMAAEQFTPEVVCDAIASDAGLVHRRSRMSERWKPVFLLARVDLWWINAKRQKTCPTDMRAWRKAHGIPLIRCRTTVHYSGGCQWTVQHQKICKEFRAKSQELAALWVAAVQSRVCPWPDVLEVQGERREGSLGGIEETGELSEPLRPARIEIAREVVGVLGTSAGVMKELGSMPIIGPVLTLLGLALEVVYRERSDLESLEPARSGLEDILRCTVKSINNAFRRGYREYRRELLELLSSIEQVARQLERYILKSQMARIWHAMWNLRKGPTTILQMIQQCENRLNALVIYQTGEVVDDIRDVVEDIREGENEEVKDKAHLRLYFAFVRLVF